MARPRFVALILLLLTLLLYLPVRQHAYLGYDDNEYITENYQVQAGLTMTGVRWAFTTFHASNWHPITWLSHMLDCELFGLNAGAHHLINVVLHATNAVLLFVLWFRLTRSPGPSAFVAAIFALHPLHVESVAWVAERKDVLSGLFFILTIWAYANYVESKGEGRRAKRESKSARRWYSLALVLFACGLMSKPMLVTLPFILLLLDYWPLKRVSGAGCQVSGGSAAARPSHFSLLALLLEKWPFFLLTIASCLVTFLAQRGEAVVSLTRLPLSLRLGNAIVSYVRYIGKVFWPTDLAVIYPFAKVPGIQVVMSALLLIVICVGVVALRRRYPFLLVGWFWFLGMLVPVIGVVQVGGQAMADRYMYLPMVGVLLMIAHGGRELAARTFSATMQRLVPAIPVLVSLACLSLTVRQLRYWVDSETLFAQAISVTRDNDVAEINLGAALEQKGQKDEAAAHYREALRINPTRTQAHNNLANILSDTGQYDEAVVHYEEALRLNPKAPMAHANFGTLLVEIGKFDEAARQYDEAMRLAPGDPRPYYLMGKAQLRQGRTPEAMALFREALKRNPDDFQTLTYLARVLASDLDPANRNGREAVALAERATDLTGGEQPMVLEVLAMAYAEAGRFPEAQQTIDKAIQLATNAGLSGTVSELESRLKLFQMNQPVREAFTNSVSRRKTEDQR